MSRSKATIERDSTGTWRVRARRTLDGESATGEVTVAGRYEAGDSDPPHSAFAGSRAWLALGEKFLEAGDAKAAISSARNGLEELGKDYADPRTKDDTGLRLGSARDMIENGDIEDGARTMLRVLKGRLAMYERLHQDEIVE